MKKLITLIAFAALTAGAVAAYAGINPQTGTNGSYHDINRAAGAQQDQLGRVCIFCHTPHNALPSPDAANPTPLWNHDYADTTDGTTWTSYQWAGSGNSGMPVIIDPLVGPSRLCLSCHDGNINFDQHGPANSPYAQTGQVSFGATSPRRIGYGQDLSTTHPIGFSYDAALQLRNVAGATPELATKADTFATDVNVNVTYDNPAKITRGSKITIGSVLFQGDTMTCATCHDVHNKNNVVNSGGAANVNYFVYGDENRSLLCLSCHMK